MRVLVVTGDHGLPDATKWEGAYSQGDLELHRTMKEALGELPGYELEFLTDHGTLVERIVRGEPPDLLLNLCDAGFRNVATQELHVPALLEIHGIPYTGAPPAGMVLCYDKAVVRAVAKEHGVPVPGEILVPPERSLDAIARMKPPWPVLIKPAQGDGSVGIRPDAVVNDADEARRYLEWFRSELPGRAALLQEFLPGHEYGLALVGNPRAGFTAFPPLQVNYAALEPGLAPILAFDSKTGPSNPYDCVSIEPATIEPETLASMRAHAELLFERLQCRDYARFDFRTAADGQVKLLEVNSNPAWSSEGKLALMAGFGGTSYTELLRMILDAARARLH